MIMPQVHYDSSVQQLLILLEGADDKQARRLFQCVYKSLMLTIGEASFGRQTDRQLLHLASAISQALQEARH